MQNKALFSVQSFKHSSGSSSSSVKQTHPLSNNSAERRQQAIHPQNDACWHLGLKRFIPAAAVVANSCKLMTFQRSDVLQSLRFLKSSGPAAFRAGSSALLFWGCALMNMQETELLAPFFYLSQKNRKERKKNLLRAFNFSEGHTISEFLAFVILAQHQGYVPDNKQ